MAQVSRIAKLLGVLLAVGVAAVIALQTIERPRTMARFRMQQLAGYHYTTPPPWRKGNGFSVLPRWTWLRERYLPWLSRHVGEPDEWWVVNMHAENLHALSRQRGFQWFRVEKVGEERPGGVLCLVVDKRVPREWLLERPRIGSLLMRQKLKLERPECFREDPQVKALIGTTWILIDRDDPEGSLARLLPGDQIHFGTVELTCGTASEVNLGRRSWEPNISDTALSLSVYEVRGDTFSGMVFGVSESGDTMTLVPRTTVKHGADGTRSDSYRDQESRPRVRYRLVKPNEDQSNAAS
jgi:hypothetical protein